MYASVNINGLSVTLHIILFSQIVLCALFSSLHTLFPVLTERNEGYKLKRKFEDMQNEVKTSKAEF